MTATAKAVRIKLLEAGDKAGWLDLFNGYVSFYEAQVPQDVIELTWQRLLARADGMLGLVAAEEGGRPVGLANLLFHRSTWSATSYCYLEDLFVDDASRGTGIGRALIEATYREADARGCTRTYWATQEGNRDARRLYDQVAALSPFIQYRR